METYSERFLQQLTSGLTKRLRLKRLPAEQREELLAALAVVERVAAAHVAARR
jgi:hypothetical protein